MARVTQAEMRLNEEEQAFAHALATSNKAFEKASPARKRVIIAKDVLKWLKIGKIVAEPGTYIGMPYSVNGDDVTYKSVSSEERVNGDECRACALGAVFACAVERAGGIKDFWTVSSNEMRTKLGPFFSKWQLQIIETAFEASHGFAAMPFGLSREEEDKHDAERVAAVAFGAGYAGNPTRRMEAIMENIIRNKGTFVPTDIWG